MNAEALPPPRWAVVHCAYLPLHQARPEHSTKVATRPSPAVVLGHEIYCNGEVGVCVATIDRTPIITQEALGHDPDNFALTPSALRFVPRLASQLGILPDEHMFHRLNKLARRSHVISQVAEMARLWQSSGGQEGPLAQLAMVVQHELRCAAATGAQSLALALHQLFLPLGRSLIDETDLTDYLKLLARHKSTHRVRLTELNCIDYPSPYLQPAPVTGRSSSAFSIRTHRVR